MAGHVSRGAFRSSRLRHCREAESFQVPSPTSRVPRVNLLTSLSLAFLAYKTRINKQYLFLKIITRIKWNSTYEVLNLMCLGDGTLSAIIIVFHVVFSDGKEMAVLPLLLQSSAMSPQAKQSDIKNREAHREFTLCELHVTWARRMLNSCYLLENLN